MKLLASNFTPYAPRPIRFLGIQNAETHLLKKYSIAFGDRPFDGTTFESAITSLAIPSLTMRARARNLPGLGFMICHQGRTGDYLVSCWWDHENELPMRVFVRDQSGWRPVRDGEGVCVWDLEVIWHERCAYVETMLTPGVDAPAEEYCRRVYERK